MSHEINPWASPTADLEHKLVRTGHRWSILLEGIAIGLIMGLVDIHWPGTGGDSDSMLAYLGVALLLGVRHGKGAWLGWPPLSVCLYLIHLVAINQGYKQPYVEANAYEAVGCFGVLMPSGLGVGVGAILRWGIKSLMRRRV